MLSLIVAKGRVRMRTQVMSSEAVALLGGSFRRRHAHQVPQQLASRYTITLSARVELRDSRENKVLWENPGLVFRQEYDAQGGATGAVDPSAFFGQDQNALDRMTTEFSRSIVSAILEAF